MTLTGTIVVGKRPSDNDPLPIIYRGEGDPAILDALLDGDKPIDVLGCDETDKCLGPGRRTIPALGGTALRPRVAALIQSMRAKIGRAYVCTPVTNAPLVCRLRLEKNNHQKQHSDLLIYNY